MPNAEIDRLYGQIEKLADLAAEHLNCSGCPTPWWLTKWLSDERATRPIPPEVSADDHECCSHGDPHHACCYPGHGAGADYPRD